MLTQMYTQDPSFLSSPHSHYNEGSDIGLLLTEMHTSPRDYSIVSAVSSYITILIDNTISVTYAAINTQSPATFTLVPSYPGPDNPLPEHDR